MYNEESSAANPGVTMLDSAHGWWERLPLLLLTMLVIGVVSAYFLPSYPDIGWPLFAWQLLCTVGWLAVSKRADSVLKHPRFSQVTFRANGTPVVEQQRWATRQVIKHLAVFVSLSLANLFGLLISSDYQFFTRSVLFLLLCTIYNAGFFAYLWSSAQSVTAFERWITRPWGYVAYLAAMLLFASVPFTWGPSATISSGKPASWEKLLSFAQHEASKVDSGAVLESYSARPAYGAPQPYNSQSTGFEVDFRFYSPSGKNMHVDVLDVDPPRLLQTRVENTAPEDPAILQSYVNALAGVKLSPRDFYRNTEQEGSKYEQQIGTRAEPEIALYLSSVMRESAKGAPLVVVEYSISKAGNTNSLLIHMDSATGQVLRKESSPAEEQATPTSAPSSRH